MRLFLFDVDGTLVTARGAGRLALTRALERVYGTTGAADRYDFRGKTDPRIVRELMTEAGIEPPVVEARLAACFDAYVGELARLIGDGRRVELMPGVAAVVEALAGRPDALVGLLTGNIEAGARVKLEPTGLWPRFRVGAFGSDDADRRRLPGIARARAVAWSGHEIACERVVVIGDTPLDVDCARACGAVAVAVATGQHPAPELAACGPDLLFESFADVDRALALLTGGAAR
ncbi:MAG: HAD family hydrolase [Candidatus Rokubacteria bacterium]|nr:HAD family hydrolase [Candidatus Rokubacteria bacterium]MBI4629765.1 HAD family hydrolase [Candidatus Rokubacteria bacterium]